MANANAPKPADAPPKGRAPQTPGGLEMPVRVLGSTLALLSFTVVCAMGLLRGNSFGSVITSSLVALAAGGAAGVLLAFIVRLVAVEGFHHHFKPEGSQPAKGAGGSPARQADGAAAAAGPDAPTGSRAGPQRAATAAGAVRK